MEDILCLVWCNVVCMLDQNISIEFINKQIKWERQNRKRRDVWLKKKEDKKKECPKILKITLTAKHRYFKK